MTSIGFDDGPMSSTIAAPICSARAVRAVALEAAPWATPIGSDPRRARAVDFGRRLRTPASSRSHPYPGRRRRKRDFRGGGHHPPTAVRLLRPLGRSLRSRLQRADNMRAAWSPADRGESRPVERFLDPLIPVLEAPSSSGLEPVYPALRAGAPSGHRLPGSRAGRTARRGRTDLARQPDLRHHFLVRQPSAGLGQGRRGSARPDTSPRHDPRLQDQRGPSISSIGYDDIIQANWRETRPFICIAGGPRLGDQTDPALPALDDLMHASCIHDVMATIRCDSLPQHLLNLNLLVLLSAADGSPFAAEAWYRPDGTTLTAVEALQGPARRGSAGRAARHGRKQGARPGARRPPPGQIAPPLRVAARVRMGHIRVALERGPRLRKSKRPVCGFATRPPRPSGSPS